MDFINNWQAELTSALPTGSGIALPVPPAALARLSGGVYLLTLFDGDAVEIIRFNGPTGEIEARGLEGTPARAWPADSVIYAAVTAGQLAWLHQAAAGLSSRIDQLEGRMDSAEDVIVDLDQRVTELEGGGGGGDQGLEYNVTINVGSDVNKYGFYTGSDGNAPFGNIHGDPHKIPDIDGVYWEEYEDSGVFKHRVVVMAFTPNNDPHGPNPSATANIDGNEFELDFIDDTIYGAARFEIDIDQNDYDSTLPRSGNTDVNLTLYWGV